jgi:hypothetical protein
MAKQITREASSKVKVEEKDCLKKVGEKLKFYRQRAGYESYDYFAFEHNINSLQYGKYEAGATMPLNTLIKILKALNVSFEEFFRGFN